MATLSNVLPDLDLPKFDAPRVDVPDAIASAMNAAGIRRSSPRRWPFALAGVVAAGVAGWAILSNESIRARINEAVASVRERVASMRSPSNEFEPIAFPAAETKPIEPGPMAEYEIPETPDYPDGLGSADSAKTVASTKA